MARLPESALGLVLVTGGMSKMPLIRHALERRFGVERVPDVEDADRLVALGAAWIAHDERRLELAKPFEITLADDLPAELIPAGARLPVGEDVMPERFPIHVVDPRDGHARLIFTRPLDPGPAQAQDPRAVYCTLVLPVRSDLPPLQERLDIDVVVDSNLIVTVTAHSQLSGLLDTREIHQLEFGLGVGDSQ
jgi:hypothetical protein